MGRMTECIAFLAGEIEPCNMLHLTVTRKTAEKWRQRNKPLRSLAKRAKTAEYRWLKKHPGCHRILAGLEPDTCPYRSGYPPEWTYVLRDAIRARDDYRCKRCGRTVAEEVRLGLLPTLSVHHIDYDKYNCSRRNLITLCSDCHTKWAHGKNKATPNEVRALMSHGRRLEKVQ